VPLLNAFDASSFSVLRKLCERWDAIWVGLADWPIYSPPLLRTLKLFGSWTIITTGGRRERRRRRKVYVRTWGEQEPLNEFHFTSSLGSKHTHTTTHFLYETNDTN
jgi:hypothetical protein